MLLHTRVTKETAGQANSITAVIKIAVLSKNNVKIARQSYDNRSFRGLSSTSNARIISATMNTQLTASSLFTDLKSRIDARQARVGIIGLGYVGLPLALLYSEQKFPVTGFDIDRRKIDTLASGGTHIFRITPADIKRPNRMVSKPRPTTPRSRPWMRSSFASPRRSTNI